MSNKYATLNAVQKLDAVSRIARALGTFTKPDRLTIAMTEGYARLSWNTPRPSVVGIDMATGEAIELPVWSINATVRIDILTLDVTVYATAIVDKASPYFTKQVEALQEEVATHLSTVDLMPFTRAPRSKKEADTGNEEQ